MGVKVDVGRLQQTVRDQFGLEIDRDLAERMQSTIEPALADLEAARAKVVFDGSEPASFDAVMMELAPEAVRQQAAAFRGTK